MIGIQVFPTTLEAWKPVAYNLILAGIKSK